VTCRSQFVTVVTVERHHCHVDCNVFHMEKETDLDLSSCRVS